MNIVANVERKKEQCENEQMCVNVFASASELENERPEEEKKTNKYILIKFYDFQTSVRQTQEPLEM